MMIFHKDLRKIAEIIRNFLEKVLKICPKKMYTLNRYCGNSSWRADEDGDVELGGHRRSQALGEPGNVVVHVPRVRVEGRELLRPGLKDTVPERPYHSNLCTSEFH